MRRLLASALLLILALGFGPASADSTTVCSDSLPQVCAILVQEEGDYSATLLTLSVVGDDAQIYAFAGTESYAPAEYSGTGACSYRWIAGQFGNACVVFFEYGDNQYLIINSSDAQRCYIIEPDALHEC